jgi:hypothetical protein
MLGRLELSSSYRVGRAQKEREPLKILIGKYEATIYPEGDGYRGAVDVGYDGKGSRQRIKRRGRTKEIVKDKLKKTVKELETGIDTSDSCTVEQAVRDWLARAPRACPRDHQRLQEPRRVQPHPVHRREEAQGTVCRRRGRLAR